MGMGAACDYSACRLRPSHLSWSRPKLGEDRPCWTRRFDQRFCAGFSDAGIGDLDTRATAGVGEAPRHEVAGSWAVGCNGRYGDLIAALALMAGSGLPRMVSRARYWHA